MEAVVYSVSSMPPPPALGCSSASLLPFGIPHARSSPAPNSTSQAVAVHWTRSPIDSADVVGRHVVVAETRSILEDEDHRAHSEEAAVAAVMFVVAVAETAAHPRPENRLL